jgi:formylglycine-generating enzyme required for sulfatase activity
VAWHYDNSGAQTHPVGTKMANELGLYDMSGNVWEWCHDWYQDSYSGLSATDPTGPPTGKNYVIRGGSWYLLRYATDEIDKTVSYCRVDYRDYSTVTAKGGEIGFRVVLGLPL